ncbi:conjugal transfer protein TrbB [Roseobacter sp. HKCCD9010]|uniref:ATPase, T2SS/T4P/T4SS family n=1 Tax=unclassified Roseobacter TaxID=196798 RepID=UPI001491B745|nr:MULTISPECIES: ATPase, T2SS/T4P/T4SS family [unclassified Roseobacter]MBF9051915.1 conjugal transfer protein TrbB [Rhodobacterales bacterium HKCCD4356]NNV13908.1 conjugal transfer protein TrbB [Roseobacter sp. HKCCD7357]NNV18080.1 conjugal transfer protein TrbB [Roseobacter sp. HKCCD8768]NNV27540.1 conjugal transfer protein TrbB [Roseobacter sp. HKCCD8192]NNV31806.1 conjugal transfer protein TrbB [Roseobacter sp. HKCCD9061]
MNGATSLPQILGSLSDVLSESAVVEISANPCGTVYVERFGADPARWGQLDRHRAEHFIRWCATMTGTGVTTDVPIFSGRIPGTPHRVEALLPPVVDGPCFSIRRHSDQVFTLEECIPDREPRDMIEAAIADKANILIAGATGSGKTTLLNGCLRHLASTQPQTRLITIEDTAEIRSPLANTVALMTSDTISMDRLLVSALRQAPDRIVVGEVREGKVLMTLVKAWNTGHPGGFVTLHANSAPEVMPRLQLLASEVLTTDPVPILLQATDMIVFLKRGHAHPELTSIHMAQRQPGHPPKMEIAYVKS